ncbi:MAG: tRNA pseudouridine(55) synthase TruB [Candidatus Muiribacteriota bacterium]
MFGILIVNKPSGISSYDVIRHIKKTRLKSKIGYLGTLDPMARGVLPVMIGKTTKLADYFSRGTKRYLARITFGIKTDSYDITGKVVAEKKDFKLPDINELNKKLNVFRGFIKQVPPTASAKKIKGQRAYKLFREGKEFEMKPVEVEIKNLKILELYGNELMVEIECSKGTYIRSLANDIGDMLQIPAVLSSLTRTKSDEFFIEDSVKLEDIKQKDDIIKNLLNPGNFIELPSVFYNFPSKVKNGIFIKNINKIKNGQIVKICSLEGEFLALYKAENNLLKPEAVLI